MTKRAPHHHSEWVFPLISSLCLITGALWLVGFLTSPKQSATGSTSTAAKLNSNGDRPARPQVQLQSNRPQPLNDRTAFTLPNSFSEAKPVAVGYRKISNESLYVTQIDLTDPQVFLGIGLAHNAPQANSSKSTKGDEQFINMVRRNKAAITVSGTFFSMDQQKRVMGNMVSGGRSLKYSPWENYGTTLGIRAGNRLEMVTARVEGKPKWNQHWFSITAGPRLLKDGKLQLQPRVEGFTDRNMMEGKALRVGMGYPKHGRSIMLVTFLSPLTLQKQAKIMRHLGCEEAMNLDGGTSVALAKGGKILQPAGRELTNVITVYDTQYPAPDSLRESWRAFQQGNIVAQGASDGHLQIP